MSLTEKTGGVIIAQRSNQTGLSEKSSEEAPLDWVSQAVPDDAPSFDVETCHPYRIVLRLSNTQQQR